MDMKRDRSDTSFSTRAYYVDLLNALRVDDRPWVKLWGWEAGQIREGMSHHWLDDEGGADSGTEGICAACASAGEECFAQVGPARTGMRAQIVTQ
jgi:hypothetical protein